MPKITRLQVQQGMCAHHKFFNLFHTANSDLFQPQNAKLALRAPGADQPIAELFRPQLGQSNPIESRNSPQWDPIWPFGAGSAP